MKKSEDYNLAQVAVINSQLISPENKLEIIKVLIAQEQWELYCEELAAKKSAEAAVDECTVYEAV